jgi:VanZ family protein
VSTRTRWLVVAVLAVVVLVASLVPGGERTLASPFGVFGADKWLHAAGYAAIAGAATYADGRVTVGALGAFAYGVLVELLQAGVPSRTASALDAVANGVGATIGAVCVLVVVEAVDRYGAARSTPDR